MTRSPMSAATSAAMLAVSLLVTGQAGAGTLERALACQLTPAELPALMANLRAQDSGFKKPVAQLGMPTMDVFKLDATVTAHGWTADEVVVAPTRIALVLRGTTSAELGGAMQLRRDLTGLPTVDATPYVPWVRTVQPRYTSLIAYQSSHHRLQGAALLGCQYAHQGAGLWPHDVSDEEALKYFQGIANLPKPKK